MRDHLPIHLELSRRLFRLGSPLLRLWQTDNIDGRSVCRCPKGSRCPVPGKHMRYVLSRSVIRSMEDLEQWVSEGGNVGLALHFEKKGAPTNPLRLCCFDDDDGTARAWLAAQGIVSPWEVKGKRGWHVYALLADDVPDLYTKYDAFKPHPPKMDVKTSGLMVLPMDNGKVLHIDGQVVTEQTLHFLDRFNSLEGLRAWLPSVDPRTVIPGMREREQPLEAVMSLMEPTRETGSDDGQDRKMDTPPLPPARKPSAPAPKLSTLRPPESAYNPRYHGIPYHERKRLAKEHAGKVHPSIPGKDPWGRLVKAVNDCIRHYGMSDADTWEMIRDRFNPRCRDRRGNPYPWRKVEVVTAIGWAHQEGSYTTMTKLTKLANPETVKARLKRDSERGNRKLLRRKREERTRQEALLEMALLDLGHAAEDPTGMHVFPKPHLNDGSLSFKDLYEDVERWLEAHECQRLTRKRVGSWLRSHGLESYAGMVMKRRDVMKTAA